MKELTQFSQHRFKHFEFDIKLLVYLYTRLVDILRVCESNKELVSKWFQKNSLHYIMHV